MMTSLNARPYIWMLCGSFSFSLMAAFAHVLMGMCDWQIVAVFRAALVALFAGLLAWQAGVQFVWIRPLRLWVRSLAGSCSMVCTFYAFSRLPAADVVTLSNTFPLWVAVLSWPLYGQFPGPKTLAAILVGVIGVVLVEQPHLEAGNLGVFAALAAALFTAVAMLGLHKLRDIDPRAVVVHFSTVATVFCVITLLIGPRAKSLTSIGQPLVLALLFGIGLSATIGQVFLTLAFGHGAPAKVSVVGLTQIVFVLTLDVWFFHRTVNAITLIGTGLIIAPTAWLLARPTASPQSGPPPGAGNASNPTVTEPVPLPADTPEPVPVPTDRPFV